MSDAEHEDGDEGQRPRAGGGEASERQLSFIASLQKRIGLTEEQLEEVLQDVAGVGTVEELDRRQASEVIDQLMVEAKDRGVDLDSQPKASDKQVGFMRQLKRRAHLTDEEFAKFLEERAGVSEPEEVGKRDASTIIDELLKLANDGSPKGGGGGAAGGAAKGKGGGAPGTSTASAGAKPKKAPSAGGAAGAPGVGAEEAARAKASTSTKKAEPAPPAPATEDDDDRPPDRPPPEEPPEPGAFDDGDDDEVLDRDPGPGDRAPDDDDLPF